MVRVTLSASWRPSDLAIEPVASRSDSAASGRWMARPCRSREGELVALLGPSGSGKTTLLRVLAGFEAPDAGRVAIGGRAVAGDGAWVEPEHRRIGMVFQDGALFPHLTVAGNVGFGRRTDPARDAECLELVGLADRARAYPHELSGGERQRVALARALAADPSVVLLDEPFAALDAVTARVAAPARCGGSSRQAGASALLVTHDQSEALSLADTVAVMRDGRIEQVGTPEELYERPASRWLAEFLGEADVLPGIARAGFVECELGRFGASARPLRRRRGGAAPGVGRGRRRRGAARTTPKPSCSARSFYGHDQLLELELPSGLASAQPAPRVPGVAPGRPRARLDRRPGQRARAGSARQATTAR